jgi:hypothetical protein
MRLAVQFLERLHRDLAGSLLELLGYLLRQAIVVNGTLQELRRRRLHVRHSRGDMVMQVAPEVVKLLVIAAPGHEGSLDENSPIAIIDDNKFAVEPLVQHCPGAHIAGDRDNKPFKGRL